MKFIKKYAIHLLISVYILAVLFSIFKPIECRADSIYLGAYSAHFDKISESDNGHHNQGVYNNKNVLFAYEGNSRFGFGIYENSFNETNYFVYKKFEAAKINYFKTYINAGFVYGYRSCLGDNYTFKTVCPEITLELAYERYKLIPVLLIAPDSASFMVRVDF